MRILKNCIVCDKEFSFRNAPTDIKQGGGKYCSKNCQDKNMSKTLKERKIKPIIHYSAWGEGNMEWLGEKATYSAKHKRITRMFGKPSECEYCGKTDAKKYEWANKSGEYKPIREDWLRLCTSCHRKYDGHSQKMWATRRARMAIL